jgi:hypothetical protein
VVQNLHGRRLADGGVQRRGVIKVEVTCGKGHAQLQGWVDKKCDFFLNPSQSEGGFPGLPDGCAHSSLGTTQIK